MPKKIDIYLDILHIYLSETVAAFPASARRYLYGDTFREKWINAFKVLGKSFKALFLSAARHEIKDKHWIYLIGTNNYHSLSFLKKHFSDTIYVSPFRYKKEKETITQLIYPRRLWLLLLNLPVFFQLILQNKYPIKRCWDAALRATGMYESSLVLLQKYRPKSITFSNDHTMEPRALLLAASHLNIPTFFIQHACVRPDFPSLRFNHSFLEGQDAYDKYQRCGNIKGSVHLVGIPRIDAYLKKNNTAEKVARIGICSNLLDSIESIQVVLSFIENTFPELDLTYRPHPSDQRKLEVSERIAVSNSRTENPFDFLLQQDLILAGNTSIHYEATMLNVVSLYYNFDQNSQVEDTYDFVENKLVQRVDSLNQLAEIIRLNMVRKEIVVDKAKYYNAVLDTPNEGKSKALVLSKIKEHFFV